MLNSVNIIEQNRIFESLCILAFRFYLASGVGRSSRAGNDSY